MARNVLCSKESCKVFEPVCEWGFCRVHCIIYHHKAGHAEQWRELAAQEKRGATIPLKGYNKNGHPATCLCVLCMDELRKRTAALSERVAGQDKTTHKLSKPHTPTFGEVEEMNDEELKDSPVETRAYATKHYESGSIDLPWIL